MPVGTVLKTTDEMVAKVKELEHYILKEKGFYVGMGRYEERIDLMEDVMLENDIIRTDHGKLGLYL